MVGSINSFGFSCKDRKSWHWYNTLIYSQRGTGFKNTWRWN
jgi:hypothetical protein